MVFCVPLFAGMHSTCGVRICSPRIPTIGLSRKIQKQKVALENTYLKKTDGNGNKKVSLVNVRQKYLFGLPYLFIMW
jgi:hypothetical protein